MRKKYSTRVRSASSSSVSLEKFDSIQLSISTHDQSLDDDRSDVDHRGFRSSISNTHSFELTILPTLPEWTFRSYISDRCSFLHEIWANFMFYLKYSHYDNKRRKFNFTLGFISCCLTVIVAATITTIVDNAPFVILKQAEDTAGQIDMQIKSTTTPYLNLSSIQQTLRKHPIEGISPNLMAARFMFNKSDSDNSRSSFTMPKVWRPVCAKRITEENYTLNSYYCSINDIESKFGQCRKSFEIALLLIDFDKEKQMGLGRKYPEKLIPKTGEVIITDTVAKLLNIGNDIDDESIIIQVPLHNSKLELLNSILQHFGTDRNQFTRREYNIARRYIRSRSCIPALFPAKVKGILSFSTNPLLYGKIGKIKNFNGLLMLMSYKHFISYVWPFAPARATRVALFNTLFHNNEEDEEEDEEDGNININDSSAAATISNIEEKYDVFSNEFAESIVVNIKNRLKIYVQNDFSVINSIVVNYASNLSYILGFSLVKIQLKLLKSLSNLRYVSLFLQLILDVILFTLTLLAIMLLYSLLVINVETRTYELGALRMVGMYRKNILILLLVQSIFSYGVPSVIIGFIIGQIILLFIIPLLSNFLGIDVPVWITIGGIYRGLFIGLLIPIISSILPICNALSKNLRDSLDIVHSKLSMQIISYQFEKVNSNFSKRKQHIVLIAWVLVCFGCLIYYFLPLSIISGNLSLVLLLFFIIICAMLLGLILFAINVQPLLEKLLSIILIGWYEHKAIPYIVTKNLLGHRMRNKQTTLMYATSLGFIVLTTIVTTIQIDSVKISQIAAVGADFKIELLIRHHNNVGVLSNSDLLAGNQGENNETADAMENDSNDDEETDEPVTEKIDKLLTVLQNNISTPFTYSYDYQNDEDLFRITTFHRSKLETGGVTKIHIISPDWLDVADTSLLSIDNDDSDAVFRDNNNNNNYQNHPETLSDRLYTAMGSQSVLVSSALKRKLWIANPFEQFLMYDRQAGRRLVDQRLAYLRTKMLASVSVFPGVSGTVDGIDGSSGGGLGTTYKFRSVIGVSLPNYHSLTQRMNRYTNRRLLTFESIEDFVPNGILFKFKSNDDTVQRNKDITRVLSALKSVTRDTFDFRVQEQNVNDTMNTLQFVFDIATYIALFMCLFSLIASMYTNIYQQTKEIGVLRAMGLNKFQTYRVYLYEAIILVVASSILGLIVGFIVGYTMAAQQALYTNFPLILHVPYRIISIVCILSLVSAFLSIVIPIVYLLNKSVSVVMRSML